MEENLIRMLKASSGDLKELINVRKYMEELSKGRIKLELNGEMIEALCGVVSACSAGDRSNAAALGIILDVLMGIVGCEEEKTKWINFDLELGDLTLKILSAIEQSDKFQVFFLKLLSFVGIICMNNVRTWRQFARPLLNVFINKKFDFVHLEKALKEFKIISRSVDATEIRNFTRQNQYLVRGFSMLVQRIGDFLTQMDIIELVLIHVGSERTLAKGFFTSKCQKAKEMVENLKFDHFEKDSRIFLNALNNGMGSERKVYSINCNLFYFGNFPLKPPSGIEGIWLDVNRDSKRMSISCADFLSDNLECVILHVPLKQVRKSEVEYGTLSGEDCYCITMKIFALTDMYQFAKSNKLIFTALSCQNSRETIMDFIRVTQELSDNVNEKNETSGSEIQETKDKFSCTSPVIFKQTKDGRYDNKEANFDRMSSTSPITLKVGTSQLRTYSNVKRKGRKYAAEANLQVYQISSSMLDPQKSRSPSRSDEKTVRTLRNRNVVVESESKVSNRKGKNLVGTPKSVRNYSRKIYQEWANSSEDFISTQELPDKGNNLPENSSVKENKPVEQQKKSYCTKNRKTENKNDDSVRNASLLDPDGYSYRRWKMPTTSERSNFWLNKLKKTEARISEPSRDVFNFGPEDDDSDESSVFLKRNVKERKVREKERGIRSIKTRNKMRIQKEEKMKPALNLEYTFKKRENKEKVKLMEKSKKGKQTEIKRENQKNRAKMVTELEKVEIREDYRQQSFMDGSIILYARSSDGSDFEEAENIRRKRIRRGSFSQEKVNAELKNLTSNGRKEVEEIVRKMSTGVDRFLHDLRRREVTGVSTYASSVRESLGRLASERQELERREKKLEKCAEYFALGCSVADVTREAEMEIKKFRSLLAALTTSRETGKAEKKMTRFAGRLSDLVVSKTETVTSEQLRELKTKFIEIFYRATK